LGVSADVVGAGGWVDGSLLGVDDGGAGSLDDGGAGSVVDVGGGVGSVVDGGALGSLVGVGSTVDVGVSGSCARAPVVAPPNASSAAVAIAVNLSRPRLAGLSDIFPPVAGVVG
jgi:hypothetical protein